ncbi:MAG: hypothetical protein ACM3SY_17375 [Candidatus Omnitrophota bacterium]
MENKDIKNISEFFSEENPDLSAEQKWDLVFNGWINKLDEKKLLSNLFEFKLWFEAIEEFFSSTYLEDIVFKNQAVNNRNYVFYVDVFVQIIGKIINHLKDLDFEKDRYLLNFEEFIVDKIVENFTSKAFPYLKDIYSPESWFYSLRIFLQNLRHIAFELTKTELMSPRTYSALRKLYRKELMGNSLIISLMKGTFTPKMDKIYQQDICDIINHIHDKRLKKHIGIFFIFAFRVMKLNNFIEFNLNKGRNAEITIPLILLLKKKIDNIFTFYHSALKGNLELMFREEEDKEKIRKIFDALDFEYKKVFDGELPFYFEENEKVNNRKILKNIVIISDFAIKELIENVARLFKPEITGSTIFKNYISRAQKASEVKEKLIKLQVKIDEFLTQKGKVSPSDIFFDINQFIESDLNYLLFKDWNEFLNYYNNLVTTDFTPQFKVNLKAFHAFLAKIVKESVDIKNN